MSRLLRLGICLLSLWFTNQKAWAGAYDDGREAYEAGEYSKAYKALGKAAKKSSNKSKKAEALALMGAAAAKLGKKDKAKSLFSQAKALDDSVELPSAAADDKVVKKLFAKAGGKKSSGGDEDEEEGSGSSSKKGGKHKPNFGKAQNYYPFGINQFLDKKPLLAAAFGGAQALGLLLYFDRQKVITEANADAAASFADYQGIASPTDAQKQELLTFLDGNEAFVKSAQRDAQLAILITIGAYGLSVVEALYAPFGGSSKHSASLDPEEPQESWVLEDRKVYPTEARGLSYQVSLLPTHDPYVFFALKSSF